MITSAEWLTPTRVTGMAAYGVATACCGMAWATSEATELAAVLTIVECALFLDLAFNYRWMLHQLLMDQAVQWNVYGRRVWPQEIALGALFLAGLLIARRQWPARSGARVAIVGVLLSVFLWCAEVDSLHAVDRILHQPIGPLMAVSFCWVGAALMTSIGILVDAVKVEA